MVGRAVPCAPCWVRRRRHARSDAPHQLSCAPITWFAAPASMSPTSGAHGVPRRCQVSKSFCHRASSPNWLSQRCKLPLKSNQVDPCGPACLYLSGLSDFRLQLSAFQPLPGNYAVRLLRMNRIVLMPNGSRSSAPAITVLGSGTSTPLVMKSWPLNASTPPVIGLQTEPT
jgi:hypothetical protein